MLGLIYALICLPAYRLLFPQLSTDSKFLAGGVLAAQIVVIIVALGIQPSTALEKWLWDFEGEWNIPAALASMQLALVGGVALLTAFPARMQSSFARLYFLGLGLLFVVLALDEYFIIHERIRDWPRVYSAAGAVVVAATLLAMSRSARSRWKWHFCLLTGLAIAAAGALVFNFLPNTCINLEFGRVSGCVSFLFLGESLELAGAWLALVAVLGQFSAVALAGRQRRVRVALHSVPILWIVMLIHDPVLLRLELRFQAEPTAIVVDSGTGIHGFRLDRQADDIIIQLYASTRQSEFIGLGYSVHLIDQVSGESIASSNKHAGHQLRIKLDSDFVHVYRQRMKLDLPPRAPANRALWAVLTVWRKEDQEFVYQSVLESDRQLLSQTQVVLDELVLPAESSDMTASPLAVFDGGFSLDAADIPHPVHPGETVDILFSWSTNAEDGVDYSQFLHLGHVDSGEWWVYDQQPLGARLPTRLWYKGLADSETWAVPLPADLARGTYNIYTGIYRISDKERVPVSDSEGKPYLDARVPLGHLIIAG